MRRLFAVALAAVVAVGPAYAQHGGGGHAGGGGGFNGGGFSGHSGFASSGGFSRPMSSGGQGYGSRYGNGGAGWGGGRSSYYHGGWDRRRGYGYGYGVGVGYLGYGWPDANDGGYDSGNDQGYDQGYDPSYDQGEGSYDAGPYQDGQGAGPYQNGWGVAADGYAAQAPGYAGPASGADQQPVPYVAPVGSGNGARVPPSSSAARTASVPRGSTVVQPSLDDLDAVTLIFKDGRAPVKIYNYALTRTTLYVTDAKRQEIPIASLDLAATEKVNRAAGVRFQLPVTQ